MNKYLLNEIAKISKLINMER